MKNEFRKRGLWQSSFTLVVISLSLSSGCASTPDAAQVSAHEDIAIQDQTLESRLRSGISARLNAGLGWAYQVAVREAGKTLTFAAGKKTLEPGIPLSETDLLEIGSVSKVYTGILLSLAEIEGRTKLARTLGEIFPQLLGTDAGKITLYDLGLHRSGLPRSLPFSNSLPENPYFGIRKEQVLQALHHWQASEGRGPPAPKSYSNWGYLTLGLVLEKVYGRPYADLLQHKVLIPLGMRATSSHRKLNHGKRRKKTGSSMGLSLAGDALPGWDFQGFTAAAGGIVSNARDQGRLLNALENPGSTPLGKALSLSMDSGLGWDSEPGHSLLMKNGATAAHRAVLIFDRAKRRGLFIAGNSPLNVDELGAYAVGLRAKDELSARVVTGRTPDAEELGALRGRFRVLTPSLSGAEFTLEEVDVTETLGRIVAHYHFRLSGGMVRQGALLLPADSTDLWNVVEGEVNADKIRLLSRGEPVRIRLTVTTHEGKTSVFELEKIPSRPEAYPAQE